MREIKFRTWDDYNKKWDYFNLHNIHFYADTLRSHLLNGHEFYLFTGLYDKNKKEIWEGDIVNYALSQSQFHYHAEVKWNFQSARFYFNGRWKGNIDQFFDIEVIGNIYENSALLE